MPSLLFVSGSRNSVQISEPPTPLLHVHHWPMARYPMNKESLATTVLLIKSLLPDFREFLSDVDAGYGFFNFPPHVIELFLKDGLPPWATYYEDSIKIKSLGTQKQIGHPHKFQTRESDVQIRSVHAAGARLIRK